MGISQTVHGEQNGEHCEVHVVTFQLMSDTHSKFKQEARGKKKEETQWEKEERCDKV